MSEKKSLLPYYSLNESQPSTLILIHGASSSRAEFAFTTPHLSQYHTLIPALPRHSPAFQFGPFTLPSTSKLLSDLICAKAKNARAHVAGISLGGYVVLHLAAQYPHLVESVFASGLEDFTAFSGSVSYALPYALNLTTVTMGIMPKRLLEQLAGITLPEGLQEDVYASSNVGVFKEIIRTLSSDQAFVPAKAKTLVVAGAGSGKWYEVNVDNLVYAKEVVEKIKTDTIEVRAVRVDCNHGWNLQKPELFARAISAWIEGKPLPDDFVPL
ncbi:MAG: hypothetical protein L6R38_005048 [Xanthoria sp. 2 TBL-2021]|nr:MAG: hypothetical protein L6R38_005048 [Xanthoria sp. 2 TBL-2021]